MSETEEEISTRPGSQGEEVNDEIQDDPYDEGQAEMNPDPSNVYGREDSQDFQKDIDLVPLSPFEKIKLQTDRRTAHGHPVILPTEYGKHGPLYDVFAIFHNAVKRQLLVAFNTIEALLRYKFAVTKDETRTFFDWLETFSETVLAFLAVEEDEMFPFLEQISVTLPCEISKQERILLKDKMASQLDGIKKQRDRFRLLPPGEVVPRIAKIVPSFLTVIVDYYDVQGQHLPALLFNVMDGSPKISNLRTKIMKALKSRPNYPTLVVFMSHWLRGQRLKAWKNEYLGTMDLFRFEQWVRKFHNNYQTLPKQIIETLMSETAGGESTDGSSSNLSFYLNRKKNAYNV